MGKVVEVDSIKVPFRNYHITLSNVKHFSEVPGKYYGAPEDCYPKEEEEWDYEANTASSLLDELLVEDLRNEVIECLRAAMVVEGYL